MVYNLSTFTNLMDSAWYNPTYQGNVDLKFVDIPVTLGMLQSTYGDQRAPLNGHDMSNAVNFTPGQFGLAMNAAWADPSIWSDGTLSNYDIGLSAFLQHQFASDFFKLNPFTEGFGSSFNWTFNLGNGFNLGNIGGGSSVISANDPYKEQNTDKAKFERKVRLVSEIGDYDEEIEKIRKAIGSDYKKGIKEIDKLIKQIGSTTLNEKANKLYKEDFETVQENAASYSNQWAKQIANSTDAKNFKVSMSGVTKDNILDVLGNFITNEQYVQAGAASWKTLIENNFSEISKILISKAEEMRKSTKDNQYKAEIKSVIEQIKIAKTPQEQVNNTYNLFNTLRKIQAENSDKNAYERYGVPSDKVDQNRAAQVATANYNKEKDAYNNQIKLNTEA